MKVQLKNINSCFKENQKKVVKDFIKFIQEETPLSDDLEIIFVNKKRANMTTGVRLPGDKMEVLAGDRMLIDVLRTLSHEWVHEYQHQKMGIKDNQRIKSIGGPEENMASALASVHIKKFAKKFPNYQKPLYGED